MMDGIAQVEAERSVMAHMLRAMELRWCCGIRTMGWRFGHELILVSQRYDTEPQTGEN